MTATARPEGYLIPLDFSDSAAAGAVTYWRLEGTVSHDALAAAWKAQGLPEKELPKLPSPETILRRAVGALKETRRHVDPLARRGAWAVVDVTVDANTDDLAFTTVAKVYYREDKWTGTPSLDVETDDAELADTIRQTFAEQHDLLQSVDVSAWLTRRAEALQAVSLRAGGGVYFVPRQHVAVWRRMCEALMSVTAHQVFKIPALPNQEAATAILDAVASEVTAAVGRIDAELDKPKDERIGARALRARTDTCNELAAKVTAYEQLLGRPLDAIRTQLDELVARVTEAALLAQSQGE